MREVGVLNKSDVVLVTGGAGLLGTALRSELGVQGFAAVLAPDRAELDLTNQAAVSAYFRQHRPAHVFHLAGKVFGLGGNTRYPGAMFYQNAAMNLNVIEACREIGVAKVTAMGTGCVYPVALGGEKLSEESVWDGPPHDSEWAYAQAKRAMLAHLTANQAEFGQNFSYAISGNLYGPNDMFDVRYGHVAPSLIAKFHAAARTGAAVSVWGSGRAERDFMHSADAARALLLAHQHLEGPYNLGSGAVVTIRDVVEAIRAAAGGAIEVEWDASRPDGQLRRFYDLSRLQSIGFAPRFDLRSGIRDTYDWYRAAFPRVRGAEY
jgi:GDP-L-fucose synthase